MSLIKELLGKRDKLQKKYQSELLKICDSSSYSHEEKQMLIVKLIRKNIQLIEELNIQKYFEWSNNVTLYLELNNGFLGYYCFGDRGTFEGVFCYNGFKDLLNDIFYEIMDKNFNIK